MPDEFYIYLGFYVVIAIIGFVYQERDFLFSKDKKAKKGKRKNNSKDGEYEEITEEYKENDLEQKPLIKKKKDKKWTNWHYAIKAVSFIENDI